MNRNKILTFQEVASAEASENNEPMVDVRSFNTEILAEYEKQDMLPYTGDRIFVREAVAKKLARVASFLSQQHRFTLKVVYGYRHPEIQEFYFNRRRAEITENNPDLSDEELDALTHNFVAVPSVAGHPTGGAVDVTILDSEGKPLDMGTGIADFSDPEKIKTFASGLTEIQKQNRALLHDVMVQEEFAPFYGEWWHFSYGDREWACFYNKPSSLYSPIDFRSH